MVTLNKVFKLGFTGAKTKKVGGGGICHTEYMGKELS